MYTANYLYQHQEQECQGFLAYNSANNHPRPAVLVAHDWSGRNQFACDKALELAKLGYVGFAMDIYGQGQMGESTEAKQALMQPFINDRQLLGERLHAAYEAVASLPQVDSNRIAVIGFCFGGLCALDLARSGVNLKGAVSFHGLLNKPKDCTNAPIMAKILALHGYDDPMVKPKDLALFCEEMTKAKVDWQVHQYGHTQHGFTNPLAQDYKQGILYNPIAEKRALQAMTNFLAEVFS